MIGGGQPQPGLFRFILFILKSYSGRAIGVIRPLLLLN
jgi:hypothetical protein